jgi:hypothetical protein
MSFVGKFTFHLRPWEQDPWNLMVLTYMKIIQKTVVLEE